MRNIISDLKYESKENILYGYLLDDKKDSLYGILQIDDDYYNIQCNICDDKTKKIFGNDYHGFRFTIPEKYKDKRKHYIKLLYNKKNKPIAELIFENGSNILNIEKKEHENRYVDINASIYNEIIDKDIKNKKKYINLTDRMSLEEFAKKCLNYDIVSFDIFDTAIFRKVEFPNDVFDIIGLEMNFNDYTNIRKKAEEFAREDAFLQTGSREITIYNIYEILNKYYNIDKKWLEREIILEIEMSLQNPFIYNLYKKLIKLNKKIIFTTDMYLPRSAICEILKKNGYIDYDRIYISNEEKKTKGNGELQRKLVEDYKGKRIIHIGDNIKSDVETSQKIGIDACWYQDCRLKDREPYLNNISGSFFRAILNNELNNGLWEYNLYFTHGFRIGGIIAAGYCQFVNNIAVKENIDKILFCSRDCYIIHKIYNLFFKKNQNSYIETSRYSSMLLSPQKYSYDLLHRFVFRYWEHNKNSKTVEQILHDTGFDYLVEYLEDDNIERFNYCDSVDKKIFERFFLSHSHVIFEKSLETIEEGKQYFKDIIGEKRRILIVDIGWSGTCISTLRHFFETNISDEIQVIGALLCGSDTKNTCNDVLINNIHTYIFNPAKNSDLKNAMYPSKKQYTGNIDVLHMALEYLFTENTATLLKYKKNKNIYDKNYPKNQKEINQIQLGMIYFCSKFYEYTKNLNINISVSPYVAFISLSNAIKNKDYLYDVYKNFLYDASTAPGRRSSEYKCFSSLFELQKGVIKRDEKKKHVLLISPELPYTGAPRSLLRIAKVLKILNYEPYIITQKDGPFRKEFEKNNMYVKVCSSNELVNGDNLSIVKSATFAICNTIATDNYVYNIHKYVPTCWFIREALNIPDFLRNNDKRLNLLKKFYNIYCVSDYASQKIHEYTKQKINILNNCVEDEIKYASGYTVGSSKCVRFIQLGTIEYRKGYDVLIAAYKRMPLEYQKKCRIFFAGGFISSGMPFCSYLFDELKGLPNIKYLGVIEDVKKKIRILSRMDVVVVASRDESCSLVALEGAMLSKPLIVTENVGAKYIVNNNNGIIVKSDNVAELSDAMMRMIDEKLKLQSYGNYSRKMYEKYASMDSHIENIKSMIGNISTKNIDLNLNNTDDIERFEEPYDVVISLTSYPARIKKIGKCIDSLIRQKYSRKKIVIWLSKIDFPRLKDDLPKELIDLADRSNIEIRWVKENLKPHKKYFYALQEFIDRPVITVDDDAIYDQYMVNNLVDSYKTNKNCIHCQRANLITIGRNNQIRPYKFWKMDYNMMLDTPSYQLMATGVGGVLYPPKILPQESFDKELIRKHAINADDIWLKFMELKQSIKTVRVRKRGDFPLIDGTQETALWKNNVIKNENDIVIEHMKYIIPEYQKLISLIKKDMFK